MECRRRGKQVLRTQRHRCGGVRRYRMKLLILSQAQIRGRWRQERCHLEKGLEKTGRDLWKVSTSICLRVDLSGEIIRQTMPMLLLHKGVRMENLLRRDWRKISMMRLSQIMDNLQTKFLIRRKRCPSHSRTLKLVLPTELQRI